MVLTGDTLLTRRSQAQVSWGRSADTSARLW